MAPCSAFGRLGLGFGLDEGDAVVARKRGNLRSCLFRNRWIIGDRRTKNQRARIPMSVVTVARMKFSNSFLDEIRARLPVSQVVSRRVPLKRAGREWKGLSPFNREKTPSFTVNDQKGFYHCFSSGKHGDVFTFLMETEGPELPRGRREARWRSWLAHARSPTRNTSAPTRSGSVFSMRSKRRRGCSRRRSKHARGAMRFFMPSGAGSSPRR